MHTFPFGRPARGNPRLPPRKLPLLVLGAYPSALHIRWLPPRPWAEIKAVAVDLEPEPFWNGQDEVPRIDAWRQEVGWRNDWGKALPAGRLNGSSGAWVDNRILGPLNVRRDDAWITDALDWYCVSKDGAARIADTYEPFAAERDGLSKADLPSHPGENDIVAAATATELPRLRAELTAAMPEVVVTLGNAALRVMGALLAAEHPKCLPRRLRDNSSYGAELRVPFGGRRSRWLPLAHPASPRAYQSAHERWISACARQIS